MSNQNEGHNMGSTVWRSQTLDAPRISVEFVRFHVEKLQAKFRWEYYGMIVMSALVAAIFVSKIHNSPEAFIPKLVAAQLGGFFVLAGTLFLTFKMWRRVKAVTVNSGQQVQQSLEAYRMVLQQHRDHHLDAWPGILWVMGPAILVLLGGGIVYDERPNKLMRYGLSFLLVFFGLLWAAWYSKRKGRQFQRELDALVTMEENQRSQQ